MKAGVEDGVAVTVAGLGINESLSPDPLVMLITCSSTAVAIDNKKPMTSNSSIFCGELNGGYTNSSAFPKTKC